MKNYFEGIKTLNELKEKYKKLALKFHPDRGGNNEIMSDINSQYDDLYNSLQTEKTIDDGFRTIINSIIDYDINIELIGNWIWLSGNTKQYKDKLKTLNFKWARKKLMWYWRPEDSKVHTHKTMNINDIRNKYGSKLIKSKKEFLSLT